MLKNEKLRREERKGIKKLHFYVTGAKVQVRILYFFGIIRSKMPWFSFCFYKDKNNKSDIFTHLIVLLNI